MAQRAALYQVSGRSHPARLDPTADGLNTINIRRTDAGTGGVFDDANTTQVDVGTGAAMVTANIATGAAVTGVNIGTGMGVGDTITLGGSGSEVVIPGNLTVQGTTTTVDSMLQTADNYILQNSEYTADAAQTAGLVMNIDPDATSFAISGIATNVVTVVAGSPTGAGYAAGDFVLLQDPANPANAGIFEISAADATTITIDTTPTEAFSGTGLTDDATTQGTIVKIQVAVIRSSTTGVFQTATGTTAPLSYTNLATGSQTWATVLGAGNTSGGTNPAISSGDELVGVAELTLRAGTGDNDFSAFGGTGSASKGGDAFMTGGLGDAANAGGLAEVRGGQGGATGTGGAAHLVSGAGGSTSGDSGNVNIDVGSVTSGTPGDINIGLGLASAVAENINLGATLTALIAQIAVSSTINIGTGGITVTSEGSETHTLDGTPTADSGTAGSLFSATAGVGAAAGATNPGGAGGAVTLTSGIGGAASGANNDGGAGGAASVVAGAGGAGAASQTAGAGGAVNITAGAGGAAGGGTEGAGGDVNVNAGNGAQGGDILITAGNSNTGSAGGGVTIDCGSGASLGGTVIIGPFAGNTDQVNMLPASSVTINPTGASHSVTLGSNSVAGTYNIGTGAAAKTVNIGSNNTTSATTFNSGTGGMTLDADGTLTIDAEDNATVTIAGDYSTTLDETQTADSGTQGNSYTLTAGTGAASGATNPGGTGGDTTITAGVGGAAVATNPAGAGGDSSMIGGAGGAGTATLSGGAGGDVVLSGGAAGADNGGGTGDPGRILLTSGGTSYPLTAAGTGPALATTAQTIIEAINELATGSAAAFQVEQTYTAGEALNLGSITTMSTATDNNVVKADASADNSLANPFGVAEAAASATASVQIILMGAPDIEMDAATYTRGDPIYLSETAGRGTNVAPTGSGTVVICFGLAAESATLTAGQTLKVQILGWTQKIVNA